MFVERQVTEEKDNFESELIEVGNELICRAVRIWSRVGGCGCSREEWFVVESAKDSHRHRKGSREQAVAVAGPDDQTDGHADSCWTERRRRRKLRKTRISISSVAGVRMSRTTT